MKLTERFTSSRTLFFTFSLLALTNATMAQEKPKGDPRATEFYSPVPAVVTPGETDAAPPSDAIILFDGKNLDAWRMEGTDQEKAAGWKIDKGVVTVDKAQHGIVTKEFFQDYQMHLEFRIPKDITGSGQARGNSGIFLASISDDGDQGYELQILDNYNNKTYTNGQVGAIYKQGTPLANPSRKPGEWQVYDIVWNAPRWNNDGSLATPAHVTAFLNGVLVQNNFELKGATVYIGFPDYSKRHGAAPIKLQAHGDKSEPDSFRNIWIRRL